MPATGQLVRLEFPSTIDMLDCVQILTDHQARLLGFDDDTMHWMGIAVRESVINAIKHGNRNDVGKLVAIEFASLSTELVISVCDQGEGFDLRTIPDPRVPENVLKTCGRGLFLMCSFMDAVDVQRAQDGRVEVRMVKKRTTTP